MQRPQFKSLLNFRDVADSVNLKSNKQVLRPGLFYRSARPDETSASDREKLTDTYKINTILDLRTKTEHLNAAKKHNETITIAQSAAVPVSNTTIATPLKIRGIHYAEINLNGKGFERSLVWQLRYASLARLIGLMALGYRMEAISILGREVLLTRGLIGLGIDTLDHSGEELKEVFNVLSRPESWPLMVHCTQGKDRTGLVVLLVLLLCGVDMDAITNDYVQSEQELAPEMEERMKEITSIGLDESFAKCPIDFTVKIEQYIQERYGGIEKYLQEIGVGVTQQQQIRSILVQDTNTGQPW
jgi:protein-tyrosine phosphatase